MKILLGNIFGECYYIVFGSCQTTTQPYFIQSLGDVIPVIPTD